ncbi:MAG: hypothetical protein ACOX08_02910 [Methanobacterium sp.]
MVTTITTPGRERLNRSFLSVVVKGIFEVVSHPVKDASGLIIARCRPRGMFWASAIMLGLLTWQLAVVASKFASYWVLFLLVLTYHLNLWSSMVSSPHSWQVLLISIEATTD